MSAESSFADSDSLPEEPSDRGKPSKPDPLPNQSRQDLIWRGAIALAAVALYAGSVGFGWVYDDQMEVVLNSLVRSLENVPRIFSTTAWAGSGMETYLYRPLVTLTYALNYQISELEPWSYHLVNVLLHAWISVLVFSLARVWGLSVRAAGMAGLLFAVHPAHAEVVSAVFGRKDLLATLFTLLMILGHRKALERGGWRAALPVAAFGLALLSKESGVAAFPLLAALEWISTEDRSSFWKDGRRSRLYASYLAVLLVYVLIRNSVTGGLGVPDTYYFDNPLVDAALGVRLATALVVMGKGLGLLAAPLTLSPDYSFNAIPLVFSPTDWRFLVVFAGGILLLGSLFSPRVRKSPLPLALAWYLLAILPASNILVPVGTIFGERLLYLPSIAFCAMAGWALSRVFRLIPMPGTVVFGGITLLLSVQTFRYSSVWENDLALFAHAVENVPNSTKAHHKLGEEYLRVGQIGPALRNLRRALDIAPDNDFAALTLQSARRALLERYPVEGWPPPSGTELPRDPEILYALGQTRRREGDLAGARGYWEAALAQDPDHPETLGDLGSLHLAQGDTTTALSYLRRAVAIRPDMASAWYGLARIWLGEGDMETGGDALEHFIAASRGRFPEEVAWARGVLAQLQRR